MKDTINTAIKLRGENKPDEALKILTDFLRADPNNPQANYQAAWTCDSMGAESKAVPFYETAIKHGLSGEELQGAYLGLGSTYRCLGRYKDSLKIFNQAIEEFPEDRSLKTFRALTLFNLGKTDDCVEELIILLVDTTTDKNIKSYDKALRFYSDKLNETWT